MPQPSDSNGITSWICSRNFEMVVASLGTFQRILTGGSSWRAISRRTLILHNLHLHLHLSTLSVTYSANKMTNLQFERACGARQQGPCSGAQGWVDAIIRTCRRTSRVESFVIHQVQSPVFHAYAHKGVSTRREHSASIDTLGNTHWL